MNEFCDDVLETIGKYGIHIMKSRIFIVLTLIHHLITLIFIILQTYVLLKTFEFDVLNKYGIGYFFTIYDFICTSSILIKRESVLVRYSEMKNLRWSIDSSGNDVRACIIKHAKLISTFYKIQYYFVVMSLTMMSFKITELCYPCAFMHEMIKNIFHWDMLYYCMLLVYLSFCPVSLMAPAYMLIYFVLHTKFQLLLLKEYIYTFTKLCEKFSNNVISNVYYQQIVLKHLIFIIRRHSQLKRYAKKVKKTCVLPILSTLIAGFPMITGLIYQFITGDTQASTITIFLVISVTSFIAFTAADNCQRFENEYENVFVAICLMPWYTWNKRSQKLYLILQCDSLTPMKINITEKVIINYSLSVWITEKVFAMVNGLYSLYKIRLEK